MEMNENEQNVINPVWEKHEGNGIESNHFIIIFFLLKWNHFMTILLLDPYFKING